MNTDTLIMVLIITQCSSAILGGLAGYAKNAALPGGIIGLLFGPIGVIAALGLDFRLICPQCNSRVNGEPKICPYCHEELFLITEIREDGSFKKKVLVTKKMMEERHRNEKQQEHERKTKIDEIMRMKVQ